jgi:hypothetical protein
MRPEVLQVIDYFAKQIYDIQFIDLPETTKKKTVDINARLCSDALSCDVPSVTHTSEYVLSKGVWWSEKALNMFWNEQIYNDDGTAARTIRQRRKGYQKDLKKRMFTVEHEFPLGILKTKVMKKEFKNSDQVKKYLLKYNKATIVTQEENERLKNAGKRTAKKLEEAADRYEQCGIKVVEFSEFPKLPL